MPFFGHFVRVFNIFDRLRARIRIPAEPTLDIETGTLRRIQRFTNLQELVGERSIQAFITYPASIISESSTVSSKGSESGAETPHTAIVPAPNSGSDSDSDTSTHTDSKDDEPLYMKPRTRCSSKYRLEAAKHQMAHRKSFGFI